MGGFQYTFKEINTTSIAGADNELKQKENGLDKIMETANPESVSSKEKLKKLFTVVSTDDIVADFFMKMVEAAWSIVSGFDLILKYGLRVKCFFPVLARRFMIMNKARFYQKYRIDSIHMPICGSYYID